MRQFILPFVLAAAFVATAAEIDVHGSLNMDYASYFDSSFNPTNAANQDIDLSVTAHLDEDVSATVRTTTHSTYIDADGNVQESEIRHGIARSAAMGDDGHNNAFDFDGAELRWSVTHSIDLIFGDMTYSAGAFNYYFWRDPARYAVIMREESLRGIGGEFGNEKYGLGKIYFGASDNASRTMGIFGTYAWPLLNHVDEHLVITPSVDWMFGTHIGRPNTYSIGIEVDYSKSVGTLNYGAYAVWGMHPYKGKGVHSFLIEPSLSFLLYIPVNLGCTFFYAIVNDEYAVSDQIFTEDQMFFAAELTFDPTKKFSFGPSFEFHDHDVEAGKDEYSFVGLNFYVYPTMRTEVVFWLGYNFRDVVDTDFALGISGRADF